MTPENHEQRITDLELKLKAMTTFLKIQNQLGLELSVDIFVSIHKQHGQFIELFKILVSNPPEDIRSAMMSFLAKAESADEHFDHSIEKVKQLLRPPPEA